MNLTEPVPDIDAPEPPSGQSSATGRPHYVGRLYEADGPCVWCGQPPDHAWHLDRKGDV